MRYVIIGNSAAGIGAVEGIRQVDSEGEITVISKEAGHTYSRPLISYLLKGDVTEEGMKYRPDDFYDKNNCKLISGMEVSSIDSKNKAVILENGKKINYDRLLAATGSTPLVPAFEGLDTVEKHFTFASFEDAKKLEAAIDKDSRVLIVGAGLIGLKCAEGISESVGKITVVDISTRILPSVLDDDSAKIVQEHIEKQGVSFILGAGLKKLNKNTAFLDNGVSVEFDCLVIAVGVRPNVKLISDIGGVVGRGIVTNALMQTSVRDIYAAGDCTESLDISSGENRNLALLPNAYMGGECAGINMAGGHKEYDKAIPMNAVKFYGLHIITAGSYIGDIYEKSTDGGCKKLFYMDNLLKGFILVGDVDKAGIYTSLIRNMTPLDSIDFELICEKPSLMAYSKKYRQEKLGGAV